MTAPSETPKVDAYIIEHNLAAKQFPDVQSILDFARQLERELAVAMRERNDCLRVQINAAPQGPELPVKDASKSSQEDRTTPAGAAPTTADPFNCPKCGRHDFGLLGKCPTCDATADDGLVVEAYLYRMGKPGKAVAFASVDPNDTQEWPRDQWTNGYSITPLCSQKEAADTIAALRQQVEDLEADKHILNAATAKAEQERDALRKELVEAWESAVDWAGYAGEYFQDKHDLQSDMAKLERARAAMTGTEDK